MKQKIKMITAVLLAVILTACVPALAADTLVPSGRAVGIRVCTGGLLVVSLTNVMSEGCSFCPAREAGLAAGDMITQVGGVPTPDIPTFSRAVAALEGAQTTLTVKRGQITFRSSIRPVRSDDDDWKIGAMVKDRVEGIGTVTYYDPERGILALLGHGVTEDGLLCPLLKGQVFAAKITGQQKGSVGKPGNLEGECVLSKPVGEMFANSVFGVFCTGAEETCGCEGVPVGTIDTVTTGKATILATVEGDTPRVYDISIEAVDPLAETRSFLIRVTDEALIEKTGGIVQGMSGSPILQNGKLIGAVTHVLIGDPTMGYGIGIENMIQAGLQTAALP